MAGAPWSPSSRTRQGCAAFAADPRAPTACVPSPQPAWPRTTPSWQPCEPTSGCAVDPVGRPCAEDTACTLVPQRRNAGVDERVCDMVVAAGHDEGPGTRPGPSSVRGVSPGARAAARRPPPRAPGGGVTVDTGVLRARRADPGCRCSGASGSRARSHAAARSCARAAALLAELLEDGRLALLGLVDHARRALARLGEHLLALGRWPRRASSSCCVWAVLMQHLVALGGARSTTSSSCRAWRGADELVVPLARRCRRARRGGAAPRATSSSRRDSPAETCSSCRRWARAMTPAALAPPPAPASAAAPPCRRRLASAWRRAPAASARPPRPRLWACCDPVLGVALGLLDPGMQGGDLLVGVCAGLVLDGRPTACSSGGRGLALGAAHGGARPRCELALAHERASSYRRATRLVALLELTLRACSSTTQASPRSP